MLRLVTVAIGLLPAVLLGELTLRALAPAPDSPRIILDGSERVFGLPPNHDGVAGGRTFRTNSIGFRGRDLTTVDRQRDFVILVVGDSYAFGYGVGEEEAFPTVLERRLQKQHPDDSIRVITLAMPGYNTRQQLATLHEFGPRVRPRMVLIAYHLNDTHQRTAAAESDASEVRSLSLHPGRLVAAARERSYFVRFLLPQLAGLARVLQLPVETSATSEVLDYVEERKPWKRNQPVLRRMFDFARNDLRAGVAMVVVPYMVLLSDRHPPAPAYDVVMRFSAAHGVPAVNAFDYFRGYSASRLWINLFDAHPNAAGHELMARAAADLFTTCNLIDRP